jgi:hypothetical protein
MDANPPAIVVKVKLGATIILANPSFTDSLNADELLQIHATITCRTTGANGVIMGHGDIQMLEGNNTGVVDHRYLDLVGSPTINTAASQVLDVTVTFTPADAGSDFVITNAMVEVLN